MKSSWQQLHHIYWLLWHKLSWKMSLLVIQKVLGLLVNTLTTNDKYFLLNRDKLMQPIQMQRSKKEKKTFYIFFLYFWNLDQNLNILKKIWPSKLIYFRSYGLQKTCSDKFQKIPVSEDPWTNNMINDPKHSWNLLNSIFIRFIDQCELNWVVKSHS